MTRRAVCTAFIGLCSCAVFVSAIVSGCGRSAKQPASSSTSKSYDQPAPPGTLELVFTYGSEKQGWIEDVSKTFNDAQRTGKSGKPIYVRAIPLGSGESIDELLEERRQAHLTSPASAAFIEIANARSKVATGKPLIGPTENLVLSPVVIAMWKPMAEAIGWGKKPVGWSDILDLAKDDRGWAAHGNAQWGRFKFGHTHPEFSNSGLISLFAEVYAGAGKTSKLSVSDIEDPKVGEFLRQIEQSVVHYGSSTGFFGKAMFGGGPEYLSAAVLYENMVIESYDPKNSSSFPVVAIYPKEGTFWSDHPVGIVERDWVSDDHREAAQIFIKYLLETAQQERAMSYGFRPADVRVALSAPLDRQHGIDPAEPKTTLEIPSADLIDRIIKLWQANKKSANVVLVFDVSGSMQKENRIQYARDGALGLLAMLKDADRVSLVPFSDRPFWAAQDILLSEGRSDLEKQVAGLFPQGGTALYDSINVAYDHLAANPRPESISAIVVLTDGADTNSRTQLDQLRRKIRFDIEKPSIRVFTIGYGSDARMDVLRGLADDTKAKAFAGTTENIREVFKEISTFF